MKRICLWLLGLTLVPVLAVAEPGVQRNFVEDYVAGIEYQQVNPPQPTDVPDGKIEVVELFWYGCPHCYHLEPYLNKWLENKPANVVFRRIPAALNPNWVLGAQTYYTEQALGILDKTHDKLFDAIHRDHQRLNTPEAMAKFFEKYGVNQEEFMKVFNSFGVRAKLAHARKMVAAYGANSVPTIIINGKYRTDASMAGGAFPDLFKVMDFLIMKESGGGA
jgi:thiol:disulfide interchange protein DsbA